MSKILKTVFSALIVISPLIAVSAADAQQRHPGGGGHPVGGGGGRYGGGGQGTNSYGDWAGIAMSLTWTNLLVRERPSQLVTHALFRWMAGRFTVRSASSEVDVMVI
jgi:hypothetical protein